MNISRIREILTDCYGLNSERQPFPGSEVVDVWMEVSLLPDKVRKHAAELAELLKAWPTEVYGASIPPLGHEISYIQAGAVLGDQGMTFVLFAFGKMLEWWKVLDPRVVGLEKSDETAQMMAGAGMISIIGYSPK